MPEREFFSFRFAIPGYILILLIISINYVPLFAILENTKAGEVFGAFLAFLSLFSGSALGFLISQFWWWWFDREGRSFGMNRCKQAKDVFIQRYNGWTGHKLVIPENDKSKKQKILLHLEHIFDYVVLTAQGSKGKERSEDRLWSYAERKWDMYHVFSSTRLSLILGFALGTAFRIYYERFIFGAFRLLGNSAIADKVALPELWAYIFLLVSSVILVILISIVRSNVENEYSETLTFIARHCDPDVKDLMRTFPDDDFKDEEKKSTS